MEIDHIIPKSKAAEFPQINVEDEYNFWLSCPDCNLYKGAKYQGIDPLTNEIAPLFNPQAQVWRDHFTWADDRATIIGLTAIGRVTVIALNLNAKDRVETRLEFVAVGWYPPHN